MGGIGRMGRRGRQDRIVRRIVAWTAAALLAGVCAAAQDAVLELTDALVHDETGKSIAASIQRTTLGQPPLRVRLERTDRREYRIKDRIQYEISVENISSVPIVIPWSPTLVGTRELPANYRHVSLDFVLIGVRQREWTLYRTVGVYGSSEIPGSLKTLKPGERVFIHVPAELNTVFPQDPANPVTHPWVGTRAKAGVRFDAPDDPLSVHASSNVANSDKRAVAG
jgi:hypothetical protein